MSQEVKRDLPENMPTWSATDLTNGGPIARIMLDGVEYTLRITKTGKLLLTK